MNSSLVVQATASCVSLLELDEGLQTHVKLDRWEVKANVFEDPNAEIVAASINSSQIALAVSGGKRILLSVAEDKKFRVNLSVSLSTLLMSGLTPDYLNLQDNYEVSQK